MSAIKQGLAEFIHEKHALERRLRTLIAAEVKAFNDLTGTTIDAVDIEMTTIEVVGAPTEHRVSAVRVYVPLK